jgi:hypothetical protein
MFERLILLKDAVTLF